MYDETSLYKTVLPMLKNVNILYQYDKDKNKYTLRLGTLPSHNHANVTYEL